MAATLILSGFVAKDVETKSVGSNEVMEFSICENVYVGTGKGKDGGNDIPNWYRIAAWNPSDKLKERLSKIALKGNKLSVIGTQKITDFSAKSLGAEIRALNVDLEYSKPENKDRVAGGAPPAGAPAEAPESEGNPWDVASE